MSTSRKIASNASTRYPTVSFENADGTLGLFLAPDHAIIVHLLSGERIELLTIGDGNEATWHISDPDVFYHHSENILYRRNIRTQTSSNRMFDEYTSISFGGKGDLSPDGRKIAIVGTRPDGVKEIFLYTIPLDHKGAALRMPGGFGNCFCTDNQVLVTRRWLFEGVQGIELFDEDMNFVRELTDVDGHFDISGDCIVWDDSASASHPTNQRYIQRIPLNGGPRTLLLALDWGTIATHVSCPENTDWCIVECYGSVNAPHQGMILKVPLDGSGIDGNVGELCAHGSDTSAGYQAQPKCTVSRDGKMFAFTSNEGNPNGPTSVFLGVLELPGRAPVGGVVVSETSSQRSTPEPVGSGQYLYSKPVGTATPELIISESRPSPALGTEVWWFNPFVNSGELRKVVALGEFYWVSKPWEQSGKI